jgi:hypothetical protein
MHRACGNCGEYRGRVVLDITKKVEKKALKLKNRQREVGGPEKVPSEDEKPLSTEELSKK